MLGYHRILHGDCRQHMRDGAIAPGSVHCIVSSPPYWGLRNYGIEPVLWQDGTLSVYGNEPTLEAYIAHTVELFEDMGRVLRPDGVVWWNMGDTYSNEASGLRGRLLVPSRTMAALQAAGWEIRQEIIWSKPSPMPESISGWSWQRCRVKVGRQPVADGGLSSWDMGEHSHGESGAYRGEEKTVPKYEDCPGCPKCQENGGHVLRKGRWRNTTAHEVIWMITRPGVYFCDATAAVEPVSGTAHSRGHGVNPKSTADCPLPTAPKARQNASFSEAVHALVETRNPRSVWHFASESYKGAHFATFPTELPYRCLKPSCSPGGVCPTCGSQFAPVISKVRRATRPGETTKVPGKNSRAFQERDPQHSGDYKADRFALEVGNRDPERHVTETVVSEYRPTCKCQQTAPLARPLVYDPFHGSGTTMQVAIHMGFDAIGSEANEKYIALSEQRITQRPRVLIQIEEDEKRRKRKEQQAIERKKAFTELMRLLQFMGVLSVRVMQLLFKLIPELRAALRLKRCGSAAPREE